MRRSESGLRDCMTYSDRKGNNEH
ncbi:hypothetical protein NOCA250050 [metagenome]|uniref:Uncharacterized protein n=1 Tax=metagenome TaxID=256318 RepID=A0A2P2C8X6_9ZZZZ